VSPLGGADFPAMSVTDFAPILIQLVLAVTLASVIIVASHLLGQRAVKNRIKDSAYECGIPSDGKTHTRFSVKFYVTAMLFILFDIEVIFLIPWAFVYRDFLAQNLPVVLPGLFFVGLLVLGLFYEVRKGALDWEK
jgi:NADH-quinone oxidoreductase subunit A